jgi:uncharacterized SAM-binding protein YcdF (DUF218 family)
LDDILFLASKVFWLLLRPNTLALVLAIAGAALLWRARRRPWIGRTLVVLGLGYYALIFVTPASQWIVLPLEDRFARPAPAPEHVTGVIVLGGAVDQVLTEAHDIPALNGAAERMTEMLILARRYPEARLVFTGGQGTFVPGALTEAEVARRLWTEMGMPADRVTYEDRSRNTWENAVLTKALVDPKPGETWLLVTSAMHMPRAIGCFRAAGWTGVLPWPVNYTTGGSPRAWYDAPFPTRLNQFEAGLREWVGLLAYWLLGRVPTPFPAPGTA